MTPKHDILTVENAQWAPKAIDCRHTEAHLFPRIDDASELSVACLRADFSASAIARAVEDADAHLLNLNVTRQTLPSGQIVIDLRVSHRNAARVARSLERYGFDVISARYDESADFDTTRRRIDELFAHLQV